MVAGERASRCSDRHGLYRGLRRAMDIGRGAIHHHLWEFQLDTLGYGRTNGNATYSRWRVTTLPPRSPAGFPSWIVLESATHESDFGVYSHLTSSFHSIHLGRKSRRGFDEGRNSRVYRKVNRQTRYDVNRERPRPVCRARTEQIRGREELRWLT